MAEDMKSETLEIGEVNRNKAIILEDDIEEKHEEHLLKKRELVNIFVKSTEGRTIVVQMLLEETTGRLKTMVLEKSGALNGNMRLEYGGKVLKDEFSLWEYNIRENSTIFAFTAGIGGMKSPTKSKKENEKMEIEKTPVKNLKAKTASKGCENLTEVEKPIDFGYDKFKESDLEFRQAQLKIKDSEMFRIHTDGASRGNPGPASVGYVISDSAGNELYGNAMSVDEGTNNMAEYLGVIFGLRSVINLGIKRIRVYCDSELVVNQVNGKYKVVNEEMKAYCEEVKSLLKELRECEVKWIPRGENLRANQLAQEILNTNGTKLNTGTKKIGAKLTQVPQLEQTKMQEDKIEKDNGATPTKGGTKQQRLDNFLKRSSKESKPIQSVSQNNMLEELTEESHQQVDEKKLGPALPNERNNGTTEKEHPQLIICQEVFGGSKERVEDICAQYILRIAAQLPKNDEVVRAQNLGAPLLKSQLADGMVTESNISIFAKEKIDRICEHLFDHDRKIEILKDVGEQVIAKTLELDQAREFIMNYASSLEPWRSCISVLTDDILNGARALERIVNSTVEGCTELNSRVVALEAELYNMRMENEILRVKISELASPQKCNLSKIQIEDEKPTPQTQLGSTKTLSILENELKELKTKMEYDVQRLESLIVEKIMQKVKSVTNEPNNYELLKNEIAEVKLNIKELGGSLFKTEQLVVQMENERKNESQKESRHESLGGREPYFKGGASRYMDSGAATSARGLRGHKGQNQLARRDIEGEGGPYRSRKRYNRVYNTRDDFEYVKIYLPKQVNGTLDGNKSGDNSDKNAPKPCEKTNFLDDQLRKLSNSGTCTKQTKANRKVKTGWNNLNTKYEGCVYYPYQYSRYKPYENEPRDFSPYYEKDYTHPRFRKGYGREFEYNKSYYPYNGYNVGIEYSRNEWRNWDKPYY